MYQILQFCHSITRWLVLLSLLYAIFRAWKGYVSNNPFSKRDHTVRHLTATIAHIQLVIGILIYTQSPLVKYFWSDVKEASHTMEYLFFGVLHLLLMVIAIIIITFGSALAKRKTTDRDKFKTMLLWFSISLVIILIAIPWPFSPLAQRPYFRPL
jgi:hypothetical protein